MLDGSQSKFGIERLPFLPVGSSGDGSDGEGLKSLHKKVEHCLQPGESFYDFVQFFI